MKTFLKVLSLLRLVTAVLSGDTTAIAVAVSSQDDDAPAKKSKK